MKVIFKYELNEYHTQVYLPRSATFLCVQPQRNVPQMWFKLDTKDQDDLVQRNFITRPTGERYHEAVNEEYLGTIQIHNGSLVLHVFELV